ncbi:hypothetical protein CP985_09085 [Malaciobacter mytili LMG 24559]|uniref:Uncharacterized protein n=1 Tax=Malaciobacter mytili LMG 24559 TaxID=1032238 RepID=A0AAX2AF86_9BACT|nr:hypothetical protein [Malaciobacter mytili]AXH14253.1 hypothetical protein AMYT_0659 [Malaciobacter mytili LMG 24559]RXK15305.1 hypothetical protein CP985_09085 [Malaciobacter mytili LMG 24559]
MSINEKNRKAITAQVRPSLEIETIITLEALQKSMPLGKTIEELLKESATFMKKKEELMNFKE